MCMRITVHFYHIKILCFNLIREAIRKLQNSLSQYTYFFTHRHIHNTFGGCMCSFDYLRFCALVNKLLKQTKWFTKKKIVEQVLF